LKVDIDVLSGLGVEVSIFADNCSRRVAPTQHWCFKNVRCEIPLPRLSNFGSYWRDTDKDSPYVDNVLRIVIRGFDTKFTIRQLTGFATCEKLQPQTAPFCNSDDEITKFSYWNADSGDEQSFLAKDRNAHEFYDNLTRAFTCGVADDCQCREQSEECRRWIKIYACQSIFNPCRDEGLEKFSTYRTCRNVEHQCARTFICAGYPELMCNHTFYQFGIERVDQNNIPLNQLDDPEYEEESSYNRRALIIALIVILGLLATIILVAVLYVLWSRMDSMGSVVFDDSRLGEYEAM